MFLKPPGYFMIKYWEKILLENFSIFHCGMRAGKDCKVISWLSSLATPVLSSPWIHIVFP